MNILLCTSRMGIGGAETHIYTMAEQFQKLGHRVCVASTGGKYAALLEQSGIEHVTLPLDSRAPAEILRSCFGLISLCERFGADIVHAHGRIPAFICGLCERFSDFPVFVTTAHGLYDSREPLRSLSEWGAATVAVSREVESYLKNVYGLRHGEVTFIPNGVEIPDENSYAETSEQGSVISASARMDYDNLDAFLLLISVFEALRGTGNYPLLRLKLAGSGNCFYRIKAETDRLNFRFPGSAEMCGSVTDIHEFLRGSTVFVGQSRSALEAMAMGIPTVLFNNVGCAGVLNSTNGEYLFGRNYIPDICSDSHRRMSDSLVSLLESAQKRREVSDFSYEFVKKHNNLVKIAESTLDVYRETLDRIKSNVMLCGYFGAGNTGDEMALKIVSEKIKNAAPAAELSVITRNKKLTPHGLCGIGRTDFKAIGRALSKSRVLVLCGGSLIQNFTSTRSLLYYSKICHKARKAGCRVMIWGGGIGPLSGFDGEELARNLLSLLSAAGLRDVHSLDEARRLGCKNSYLSADSVAAADTDIVAFPDTGVFTVCPRELKKSADRDRLFTVLSSVIPKICREKQLRVRFVPLAPEDSEICQKLADVCHGDAFNPDTPENTAKLIAESSFCLAVRLHAAVLAFSANVPFAAISYDPKVRAFAEELSAPCIELKELTESALLSAVELLSIDKCDETLKSELKIRSEKDTEAFRIIYDYNNLKDIEK